MNMRDDEEDTEGVNITLLVERFEEMSQKKQPCYFDVEDFESIIEYYLLDNKLARAYKAAQAAAYYHPASVEIKLKQVELEIESDKGLEALAMLKNIEALSFHLKAPVQFLKARALLLLDRIEEAVVLLDGLQNNDPNSEELAWHLVIGDLIQISEFAHALRYLEHACKQQQESIHLLLDLAYCYEQLDEIEKAAQAYEQYLDENPFSSLAWGELAKLYDKLERFDDAVSAYDFARTLEPSYVQAYSGMSDALMELERYEEAIKVLKELVELDPANYQASYVIGECCEKLGRSEEAMNIYLSIIEQNELFADAHYGVAYLLKEQNRLEESLPFLQKAISLDPDNSEYYYGLGKALMEMSQENGAIDALEQALEIDEADFESWLLLSEIHARTDFSKALQTLERACAYVYDVPQVCYRMAALYFLSNDMDKCLMHFERGLLADVEQADDFFQYCPAAVNEERIMTTYLNSKIKHTS